MSRASMALLGTYIVGVLLCASIAAYGAAPEDARNVKAEKAVRDLKTNRLILAGDIEGGDVPDAYVGSFATRAIGRGQIVTSDDFSARPMLPIGQNFYSAPIARRLIDNDAVNAGSRALLCVGQSSWPGIHLVEAVLCAEDDDRVCTALLRGTLSRELSQAQGVRIAAHTCSLQGAPNADAPAA